MDARGQPCKVSLCPPGPLHAQVRAADTHVRLHVGFCAGEQRHNSCYHLRASCVAARNTDLPQEPERELIFCANILLGKENPRCIRWSCTFSFTSRSPAELPPSTPLPAGSQQTPLLFHSPGQAGPSTTAALPARSTTAFRC